MEVRDLLTRFGADTSGFTKGASEVKAQLTVLNKDFYANKAAMKEVNGELKKLETQEKELKAAMQNGGTAQQKTQFEQLTTKINATNLKLASLKTTEQDLKSKISNSTSELKQQNSTLGQTSTYADKAKSSLDTVVTALKAVALGYTGKKLYEALIGSNADMEQYLTSFEVLLGSAEKAAQLMNDLTNFATVTPLTLDEVVPQASLLLSYGVQAKDLINTMTMLGDLSSGNAEKFGRISLAYGQMLAKGKVTGEELRQITEAGVPLLQTLADTLGVTTGEYLKMQEAGEVSVDILNQGLENLTTGTGRFAGMMEKQAGTMNGMLSTLKDTFAQLGRDVGEGAFNEVKGAISEILTDLQTAKDNGTLDAFAEGLGSKLANASKFVWEHKNAIAAVATAYLTFKVAMAVGTTIASVTLAVKSLTVANQTATASQLALNTAVKANPYVLVASAILSLISLVATFALTSDNATDSVSDMRKEMEQLEQSNQDNINTTEGEIALIQTKAEKYEELRLTQDRSAEQEKTLKGLAEDLQAVLPDTISVINKETGAYQDLSLAIADTCEQMRAKAYLSAYTTKYESLASGNVKLEDNRTDLYATARELAAAQENHDVAAILKITGITPPQIYQDNLYKKIAEINTQISKNKDEMDETYQKMLNAQTKANAYDTIPEEKETESPQKTPEEILTEFKTKLASNKFLADTGKMTEAAYYTALEKMLGEANAEGNSDYNSYFVDLYNQKTKKTTSTASTGSTVSDEFKQKLETKKFLLDLDEITEEQYYKDLSQLLTDYNAKGNEDYNSYYVSLYNYKKGVYEKLKEQEETTLKESLEAQKAYYENAADAYQSLVDARLDAIDEELEAEQNLLNEKLSAINTEIEARKRLTEDRDIQKEVDAVTAELKFSQLDSFSRMELEKQLTDLKAQQSELAWQRQKADEKEAAEVEYAQAQAAAAEEKEDLKSQLAYANEIFSQLASGTTTNNSTSTTNNNTKASIKIVTAALSDGQIIKKIQNYLSDGVF